MGRSVKPHDLLRLAPTAPGFADAPEWVAAALARAPYVVVRRSPPRSGAIAVGVRGMARHERFGAWLDARHVMQVISPEALRGAGRTSLPAFALLHDVARICDGYVWGPTGSVGFELASGVPTVTPASDLDLLIRSPGRLDRAQAAHLHDALEDAASARGARMDVQIETRDAAFSLAEFARAASRVMLRSNDGPKLVADPWQTDSVA
jgi:phosphoribosyl-dephospho-CoA transferase